MKAARCTCLSLILGLVASVDFDVHQKVPVLVNTVGPFNNPAEAYPFYDLPYCVPKDDEAMDENFGSVIAGDRRRTSMYDVRFKVDVQWAAICTFRLTQDEIKEFRDSIQENYMFEMFVDGLPIKGFVGEFERSSTKFGEHVHNETRSYLFTHLDFSIAYNGKNVIAANLTTDPDQRIELVYGQDLNVEFSYSVHWTKTKVTFADRNSMHQRIAIGDQAEEIHWLSIINSFVLVILLTAFLAVILMRVLRKDFARYMDIDDDLQYDDDENEAGWKQVHADVFRFPKHIMILSAAFGSGVQILILVICILLLSLVGTFYPGNRGAIYTAAVLLYAATAGFAGYASTYTYIQLGGEKIAFNAVLTASLFTVPFFFVFCIVNTIAIFYGSSSALPAGVIFVIMLIWAFVTFPLTALGSMRAKARKPRFGAPCKTNRANREIPPVPWYKSPPVHYLIAGFLPFSAIYIELHYVFASVWGHRVYTLFGILSLAFVMLLIVTAFITIALTYFQLASEDYHWWWRSFLSGASMGVFIYAYGIFFFQYRSDMTGLLQGAFFFGYLLMISYAFSLMLGAVSFFMAKQFVKHIYFSIKLD